MQFLNFQANRMVKGGAAFLLLALFGCHSSHPSASPPPPITAITISSNTTSVVIGQTFKVSAFGVTTAGTSGQALPVSWTSDNTAVATVTADGVVSGLTLGVATLSASYGELYTTKNVGVVSPSSGSANLSVAGVAFYEDKPYTLKGFTGERINTPIRQAVINLIAIDGFTTLASSTTGQDGSYRFSPVNNRSRRGGVYVQVLAKTSDPSPITIMDNETQKNILAMRGTPMDDSTGDTFALNMIVPASGIGGAFNILDTFLKGIAFIQKGVCPLPNTACQPPLLTAYWAPGDKKATFYTGSPVHAISIDGGKPTNRGDADEYDDTIIAHEYGHFIAAVFAQDNSPGGPHAFFDNAQDIRLSWSEGWATFFAAAMLGSPLYVDTGAQSTFGFTMEILPNSFHTTSEAAIGRTLWDILDAPSKDDDPMTTTGFDPIWKAATTMTGPATMESFAVRFMGQNPQEAASFQTLLQQAKMELFPDTAETTGEITPLLNTPQHHTLYALGSDPFVDTDKIPLVVVSGQRYTLKTENLTNGADTFLTLEDSAGKVLLQNDNTNGVVYAVECQLACPKNDSATLASSILFTAGTTETLFAHVRRSSNAPLSTGHAGSYDIRLTSP